MILIKVLTKTKYLSFHFVFNCAQRGFVCSTRPLVSSFLSEHAHAHATTNIYMIIKHPKNSICIAFKYAKYEKGAKQFIMNSKGHLKVIMSVDCVSADVCEICKYIYIYFLISLQIHIWYLHMYV